MNNWERGVEQHISHLLLTPSSGAAAASARPRGAVNYLVKWSQAPPSGPQSDTRTTIVIIIIPSGGDGGDSWNVLALLPPANRYRISSCGRLNTRILPTGWCVVCRLKGDCLRRGVARRPEGDYRRNYVDGWCMVVWCRIQEDVKNKEE